MIPNFRLIPDIISLNNFGQFGQVKNAKLLDTYYSEYYVRFWAFSIHFK